MQSLKFIGRKALVLGLTASLVGSAGCAFDKVDPVPNPNGASLDPSGILNNPSLAQISLLATGTEASLRFGHSGRGQYNQLTGTFGREIYILALNDNRYYTELLGTNTNLDPAGPYNDLYTGFSQARHAAIVLRGSAETAVALNETQKKAIRGYTRTVEALAMLHLANLQFDNGIRLDVNNIFKPSKFTESYQGVLTAINALLNTGADELAAGGASFAFPLTPGYAGFDTPASYLKFNRALAARVNIYRKDYVAAQTALAASFYDPAGSLKTGPKIVFNAGAANDIGNPYFQLPNSSVSTLITPRTDFVTDAEAGDARLVKATPRTAPRTLGGLTGAYDPAIFNSQTAPLDLIRNEELILIAAEINIEKAAPDLAAATSLLNIIRTKAGNLPNYSGAATQAALRDEMLNQRRYSLFYEGHRWVDLRRYGRLATLPLDLTTHKVFDRMPRPVAEVQWDAANP